MAPEDKTPTLDAALTNVEPPKIYIPSCGVLCDIFWWARRNTEPPAPITAKPTP